MNINNLPESSQKLSLIEIRESIYWSALESQQPAKC